MRIAIDISGIFAKSGLGNYIRLLIENLAKVGKENEYFLYTCFWRNFGQKIKELELPQQENFHLLSVRLPETAILFEEHVLKFNLIERILIKHRIDVFHGPGNIIPNLKQIKSVLTIHHYYPSKKFYFKCTDFSIHKADHIIAISENTKKDLIREFNMDENRITVIYEGGPDKIYCQHNDIDQEVIKKYNLPQKYILFVGPINERKNLIRLIEAYQLLKRKGVKHKLVVTGGGVKDYIMKVRTMCVELGLGSEVVFTGSVAEEELVYLYNLADLFVYPSLYEGFGYPPLEAMACGCPVVASNVTSMPEVVGDAAVLIDPYDVEGMANAIERVLSDDRLRAELVKKGFEQVKKFSWEKTAKETLEVYKKVYDLKK